MPIEKLRPSYTFIEERLKELEQVVPEAFADGKVKWEVLKEVMGEYLGEEGEQGEHFGLTWPGKAERQKVGKLLGSHLVGLLRLLARREWMVQNHQTSLLKVII